MAGPMVPISPCVARTLLVHTLDCSSGPPAAEASVEAQGVPLNFRGVGDFCSPPSSLPAQSHHHWLLALLPAGITCSTGTHGQRGVNGNAALKVLSPLLKKTTNKAV